MIILSDLERIAEGYRIAQKKINRKSEDGINYDVLEEIGAAIYILFNERKFRKYCEANR